MNKVLPTKSANQAAVSTPLSQHPPLLLKLPTTPDCEFRRSLFLSQPKDPKTFLGLNRDIFCSVDEIRNIFKLVNKTTLTKSIKDSSSSLHSVKITEIYSHTFGKNFVKSMFLLKKLLKNWFHEINFVRVNLLFFHTVCALTFDRNHLILQARRESDEHTICKTLRGLNNFVQ